MTKAEKLTTRAEAFGEAADYLHEAGDEYGERILRLILKGQLADVVAALDEMKTELAAERARLYPADDHEGMPRDDDHARNLAVAVSA